MTIAQQLNIKEFPFTINDKNDNLIYFETSGGFWIKYEYDLTLNKMTRFENSDGLWSKFEYDSEGHCVYIEDHDGNIVDKRLSKQKLTFQDMKVGNIAKIGENSYLRTYNSVVCLENPESTWTVEGSDINSQDFFVGDLDYNKKRQDYISKSLPEVEVDCILPAGYSYTIKAK